MWTLSARILLSIAAYVLSYILFVCSSIYWDLVFLFKTQSRVFIIINIVAFIIIGLCYNKFEKSSRCDMHALCGSFCVGSFKNAQK